MLMAIRSPAERRATSCRGHGDVVGPSAWQAAGIEPTARPEELSVADWVRLAEVLRGDGDLISGAAP